MQCTGDVAAKTSLCRGRMRVLTQTNEASPFGTEWSGDGFFPYYADGQNTDAEKPCYECVGDF